MAKSALSQSDVLDIRNSYARGETLSALGCRYDRSKQAMSIIVRGESHTHYGGPITRNRPPIGGNNGNARLTDADIIPIRDSRSKGVPVSELVEEYGVSRSRIFEAANGQTWMHIKDMPPPFRLTKNGAAWMLNRLQQRFPDQAYITPAAFADELCASNIWFSRMCEAGKLKTEVRQGVRMVSMRVIEHFLSDEYGSI